MTTFFISGVTRGIGRSLATNLLSRPNTTVVAGVRDLQAPAAISLSDIPTGPHSKLITVRLDSASESDAKTAMATLQTEHGIDTLDTVIANAGMADVHGPMGEVSLETMRDHFTINTLGPLLLFQATLPLLRRAKEPRFFVTTSLLGSATVAPELTAPLAAYGASKAAVNYLARKATGEYPDVAFVVVHPGLVATEMGDKYVELTGDPAISVEESVEGYLKLLDMPVEEIKGKFMSHSAEEVPW